MTLSIDVSPLYCLMPYTHAPHSSGHTFLAILGIAMLSFVGWELLMPHPDEAATAPTRISAQPHDEAVRPEPEVDRLPAPLHAEPAAEPRLFKCANHGHIEYSDSPCPEGAKALAVDATPAARGVEPVRASTSISLPEPAPRPAGGISTHPQRNPDTQAQCRQIDEEVRAIDARARQYHSSEEGSWLAEKRRRAMDRRTALGCYGD